MALLSTGIALLAALLVNDAPAERLQKQNIFSRDFLLVRLKSIGESFRLNAYNEAGVMNRLVYRITIADAPNQNWPNAREFLKGGINGRMVDKISLEFCLDFIGKM
jgi:hypothetical protein